MEAQPLEADECQPQESDDPWPNLPQCSWTGFRQSLPSEQFLCHTPISDLFTHLAEAALQTVCG